MIHRRNGKLVLYTTDLDKLFSSSPDSSDIEDGTSVLNTQCAVNTVNKLNLEVSNRTDMVSDKECKMKNDEECDMNKDESANLEENFSHVIEKSASTLLISGSKLKLDGTKHGSFTEISSSVGQHTIIEKSAPIKKWLRFSEKTSASQPNQTNQEPPVTFQEEVSINRPPTGTEGIKNSVENTKMKHQHKVLMHSHLSPEKQISSTHKIFPEQKISAMEMKSKSFWFAFSEDEESDLNSFEDQFVIKPAYNKKLGLEDSQKNKRDSKNKTLNSRHSVSSTKKVSNQKSYKNSVTESSNFTYSKRRKSYQSESSSPVCHKNRMKKTKHNESSSSSFQSSNAYQIKRDANNSCKTKAKDSFKYSGIANNQYVASPIANTSGSSNERISTTSKNKPSNSSNFAMMEKMKKNRCSTCKKILSCSDTLKTHYRIHTGERPFVCSVCKRGFTTRGNLSGHCRRIHNLELPLLKQRRSSSLRNKNDKTGKEIMEGSSQKSIEFRLTPSTDISHLSDSDAERMDVSKDETLPENINQ